MIDVVWWNINLEKWTANAQSAEVPIAILGVTLNATFNALRAWLLRGFAQES